MKHILRTIFQCGKFNQTFRHFQESDNWADNEDNQGLNEAKIDPETIHLKFVFA